MILSALLSMATLALIIAAGYMLSSKKIITEKVADALSKIIVYLTLPCTIIYTFQTDFSLQKLASSLPTFYVCFASVVVGLLLGWLFAKILRIPANTRGVFMCLFGLSNSAYVGFPVVQMIYGNGAMEYALIYFAANMLMSNTVAFVLVRKDADTALSENNVHYSIKDVLKRLLTPPVIALGIAIVFTLLSLALPDFLLKSVGYLANMTTPTALIFTGYMIYSIGFKHIKPDKKIWGVSVGRFIVAPLLLYPALTLIHPGSPGNAVITLQASMPSMIQVVVLSKLFKADSDFATKAFVITTLLGLVTIPITAVIFK